EDVALAFPHLPSTVMPGMYLGQCVLYLVHGMHLENRRVILVEITDSNVPGRLKGNVAEQRDARLFKAVPLGVSEAPFNEVPPATLSPNSLVLINYLDMHLTLLGKLTSSFWRAKGEETLVNIMARKYKRLSDTPSPHPPTSLNPHHTPPPPPHLFLPSPSISIISPESHKQLHEGSHDE
ncbi:unnamed protein product, partial [Pleuronectes platessa]